MSDVRNSCVAHMSRDAGRARHRALVACLASPERPVPAARVAALLLLTALPACDGSAAAAGSGDASRGSASSVAPWFTDATQAAGLAWSHHEGAEQWDIRPTMGPGCAWADV